MRNQWTKQRYHVIIDQYTQFRVKVELPILVSIRLVIIFTIILSILYFFLLLTFTVVVFSLSLLLISSSFSDFPSNCDNFSATVFIDHVEEMVHEGEGV